MRAVGKILTNGKLEVTIIHDNGTSEVILKAGSADRKFVGIEKDDTFFNAISLEE
jgi:hypothetical protein